MWIWILLPVAVFVWSAIMPRDTFTWFLEVLPVLMALPILVITRGRFPLSRLTYALISIHAMILMVGAHYTYAEVPLFDWLKDLFGWQRNNYDKVGHFAQGFVPAIVAREVLLRLGVVNGRGWMPFIVVSIVLAFSAFYEMIEWWVSVMTGSKGDAFLGTQGYVFDTQSDMFMAMAGGVLALLLLSRWHDASMRRLAVGRRMTSLPLLPWKPPGNRLGG